jgi:hypothetical protein
MTSLFQPTVLPNRHGLGASSFRACGPEAAMQHHCVEIGKRSQVHDRSTSETMCLKFWSLGWNSRRRSYQYQAVGAYASFKEIDHDYSGHGHLTESG